MAQRTFLITGAGSGIGKSTAFEFSKRGDRVILAGRTPSHLEQTHGELSGHGHMVLACDQRDPGLTTKAINRLEKLDGIIANAGIGGENQFGEHDRWDDIIATNLSGTYHVIMAALPLLKKSPGVKHITMVSSILARLGVPGYTAYCASKAGMLGLMRALAAELTAEQILVNAICPGWVDTQMARDGIKAFAASTGQTYNDALQQQMSHVPLKKMSQPEEIAALLTYLTSPMQTSITGQTFDINNGALMPC